MYLTLPNKENDTGDEPLCHLIKQLTQTLKRGSTTVKTFSSDCIVFSLQGPLYDKCNANSVTNNVTHVWASTLCPLEDECKNGRDTCDPVKQVCIDTPEAYKCVCKQGYDDSAKPG